MATFFCVATEVVHHPSTSRPVMPAGLALLGGAFFIGLLGAQIFVYSCSNSYALESAPVPFSAGET